MTNWPRGGYAAGDTPASELKPPPDALVSKAEQPKYTESDMRVLTEAALRQGRAEMAEEITAAIEQRRKSDTFGPMAKVILGLAAGIAREIGSKPSPDSTSGRTDPKEGA